MQLQFEELIGSLLANNVGISNHFIPEDLSNQLRKNILALIGENALAAAKIGNDGKLVEDQRIRNDKIFWLDKAHDNLHENDFLNLMGDFISHLNMTCYAGITKAEFHYSCFEKGNSYSKHLDQFKDNSSRKYSMISYLNEAWRAGDGGELKVYHEDCVQEIEPTCGKTVFFKSNNLEHEVLITNVRRLSIAGWLKG